MGGRGTGACRRGLAAALLAVATLGAAVDDSEAEPSPGSELIGCDRAAARVEVAVTSHLDPSCTYTGGFDITASDVVFDCQGAAIVNMPQTANTRGIDITTPVDASMSGVTVRNCRVQGFTNSVRVTRVGFRGLPAGHEFDEDLSDVLLEGNELRDSRGVGIFVDGYVSGVVIRDNVVTGAGSTGIYLEAGSKEHVVADNVLVGNGFRENGPNGDEFRIGGQTLRFWGPGREGLAIDGSWGNVVTGNRFEGNAAGGIFLYTNCGEFWRSRPDRYYERRHGADHNLIEGNHFAGGEHGVWVGSRMGENTFPMECKDRAYVTGPLTSVALDRAAGNTVRDNTFDDVTYGVRVEDDGTRVEGNRFSAPDATHHAVIVGTRVRTSALGRPVHGAVVADNVADIAGNPSPYRWVHGVTGLRASGNRALGSVAAFCESPPLPFNQMIFVHAAVVQDPNGPPAPKPDFVVPTLGELPPCRSGALPAIEPGAGDVVEGDDGTTTVVVPVHLSEPSPVEVSANWSTRVAGAALPEATPGEDYDPANGVVRFAPGQMAATVAVPVRGDRDAEPAELIVIGFEAPSNARIGGFWGLGFGRILDDDPVPIVVPGQVHVDEGDAPAATVTVPVTLSAPSQVAVTASWATLVAGGAPPGQATPVEDYAAASGTVTFAPGQTEAAVELTIYGDELPEGDEYVLVAFSSATNAHVGGLWGLGGAWIEEDDR